MRHLVRTVIAVLISFLFSPSVFNAGPQGVDIAKTGATTLRAVLGGKTIKITFDTATIKKSDPGFPLALDYYDEMSIVQRMTIVVGGKTVWVPRSAYADLFDAGGGFAPQ